MLEALSKVIVLVPTVNVQPVLLQFPAQVMALSEVSSVPAYMVRLPFTSSESSRVNTAFPELLNSILFST